MDAVFSTRRIGTDAVFARLFYEAAGDHLISIANSQQINTASQASIQQTHLITASDSQQVNTASPGAVTQSTTHYITVADSQQVNTASDAAITSSSPTTIGSISDADIARIVAAVLAALQTTAIPVNVKKVNDRTVVGDGLAPPNHWRPA